MRLPTIQEEADGVLIVTVDDPKAFNDGQLPIYRDAIFEVVHSHPQCRLALDLGPIDFLSSAGIGVLVGLKRRVEGDRGRLVLFGLQREVVELLTITRIAPLFVIAADRPSALAALRTAPSA